MHFLLLFLPFLCFALLSFGHCFFSSMSRASVVMIDLKKQQQQQIRQKDRH